jgi:hypothetical protein
LHVRTGNFSFEQETLAETFTDYLPEAVKIIDPFLFTRNLANVAVEKRVELCNPIYLLRMATEKWMDDITPIVREHFSK